MTTTGKKHERVGVLLVNTGTPSEPTPQAVKHYLGKFLMDPRICPMNPIAWWVLLHAVILRKRAAASAEKYQAIWTPEGSPFQVAHERLVKKLQAYYDEQGANVQVELAMSYSEPTIVDALHTLRAGSCARLVVLPLYPQSAYSTTGAVRDGLDRAIKKTHWKKPVTIVDDYHENDAYVSAIATQILNAGFDVEGEDRLLFSFHSIPLNDIEKGDTYELQVGASSLLIAGELGIDRKRWTIGYQCRFDKGREWLNPFTKDVLARWSEAGKGRVFAVCPNFAVDCLETLYEFEHEFKPEYLKAARDAGRVVSEDRFVYVPCLNDSDAHCNVLVDVLKPYLRGVAR